VGAIVVCLQWLTLIPVLGMWGGGV
jgi:hypothetical protein